MVNLTSIEKKKIEIIVIMKLDTGLILKNKFKQDKSVNIILKKRIGLARSIFRGILNLQKEYVVMDTDFTLLMQFKNAKTC